MFDFVMQKTSAEYSLGNTAFEHTDDKSYNKDQYPPEYGSQALDLQLAKGLQRYMASEYE